MNEDLERRLFEIWKETGELELPTSGGGEAGTAGEGASFLLRLRARRPDLQAWRDPKTGRFWPDFCAFLTDPLTDEELEVVRDLVMTDLTGEIVQLAVGKWNMPGLLARLLATIERRRR